MLTFLFTFQDSDLQCFQPQFTDIIPLQSERKLSLKIIGSCPLVFEETFFPFYEGKLYSSYSL